MITAQQIYERKINVILIFFNEMGLNDPKVVEYDEDDKCFHKTLNYGWNDFEFEIQINLRMTVSRHSLNPARLSCEKYQCSIYQKINDIKTNFPIAEPNNLELMFHYVREIMLHQATIHSLMNEYSLGKAIEIQKNLELEQVKLDLKKKVNQLEIDFYSGKITRDEWKKEMKLVHDQQVNLHERLS